MLRLRFKTNVKTSARETSQIQFDRPEQVEKAIESLTYPISGSPSHGKRVAGIICLHVDDIFCVGDKEFYQHVVASTQQKIIKLDQKTLMM